MEHYIHLFIAALSLPIVGGLNLYLTWNKTRYEAVRDSGHKLYLRAIYYGVILLGVSIILHGVMFSYIETYNRWCIIIVNFVSSKISNDWNVTSVSVIIILSMSCFLGKLVGHILNFARWSIWSKDYIPEKIQKWSKESLVKIISKSIENDSFEMLLLQSCDKPFPILVILESGEFYIGIVGKMIDPKQDRKWLYMNVFFHGYKNQNTEKLTFVETVTITKEGSNKNRIINNPIIVNIDISKIITAQRFYDTKNLVDGRKKRVKRTNKPSPRKKIG